MIPTRNYSSRGGQRVRLVVLHTTEGARTVDSLGAYFQQVTNVSYHGAFDDQRFESYVNYSDAAWSIRNGNPITDNAALCAFAAWDRAEWLRHPRMLDLAAAWVAERCTARAVPIRRLTIADTAAAVRDPQHPGGVIMHRDYTQATGDGTHTDCGDNLPWDVILPRAQQLARLLEDSMAADFDTPRKDLWGNQNTYGLALNYTEKRVADTLTAVNKIAGDVSFAHTSEAKDLADLKTAVASLATSVATVVGDVAEIKALIEGKAPTSTS